ncbi:hypothetical protein [Persicobacter diffluens]|uniref:hypothetical protein n=1 Tax=Persicobacter diffluens TaxID=981 RepID=UPI0030C69459
MQQPEGEIFKTKNAIQEQAGQFGILINEDGRLTEQWKLVIQKTSKKHFGKPEEHCGAIQFPCTEASSFITGTINPIDSDFSSFSEK